MEISTYTTGVHVINNAHTQWRIQDFSEGLKVRLVREGGEGGVLSVSGPIQKAGGGGWCCRFLVRYEKWGGGGGGLSASGLIRKVGRGGGGEGGCMFTYPGARDIVQ